MKHLLSFSLFENRKMRDYRYDDNDSRAMFNTTDDSAEEKLRLQIAPIYDWCNKTVSQLVATWNRERNSDISMADAEDTMVFEPTFNFNSQQQYEEEGFSFTFEASYCKFYVRRMDGRLTIERVEPKQVIFAPRQFEQELHDIFHRSTQVLNRLLDNDGDYLSKHDSF